MSRETVILAGREFSEKAFTATASVLRATGAKVSDPVTLEEVDEFAVVRADVPCKIKQGAGVGFDRDVPGQALTETQLEWHVPISVTEVRAGDQVLIVSVDPATGDPALPGQTFRVQGPFFKSHATARRFRVDVWS